MVFGLTSIPLTVLPLAVFSSAYLHGYGKIVQLLLERPADIDAQGGDCGSALQAACSSGLDKIARTLLNQGA